MHIDVRRALGNRPADVTSFVGRRRELAEAKALLRTSRLITFTGMGGVGKTRLAVRMAADINRSFLDGVWLVELAGLQDASLLAQTVSAAFGVDDRTAGSSLKAFAGFLHDRQVLLVLDNCEHILDACAVMADALLRSCPGLRILATSRRPLGIAGEQTLAVPRLSMPHEDHGSDQQSLTQFGAVSLFLDRASAVEQMGRLPVDNYDDAVHREPRFPQVIRGYEHIKLAAVKEYAGALGDQGFKV